MNKSTNKQGWIITFAALGINLIMGVLYSWGVIKKALVSDWGWTNTEAALPFTVSAAVFALTMIFAGRAQDKYGPRMVTIFGGIMLGSGLILSGFVTSQMMMVLTFGVIGSTGIGLGYSAATPCAMKWFESSKKGMIAGIVVAGVGLSPVYITPVTASLLKAYGISNTFIILGIFAIAVVILLSFFLKNPQEAEAPKVVSKQAVASKGNDFTWNQVTRTPQFYLLWVMYLLAATAGLMLIAHLPSIAVAQADWKTAGFMLVVILSIFNAVGRLGAGVLSDKVGRTRAMMIVFMLQAVNMFLFMFYTSIPLLIMGSAIAGLAYGAVFSLFPTTTAEYFGMKNLGVNYGLIFTGWGVAGVIGPMLGGIVADKTGAYSNGYIVAGVFLLIATLLVSTMKSPKAKTVEIIEPQPSVVS
ncbi:MAG TPA: oxalate:formate antiporter [Prolixibacteraceae bacterium]|jgi:OFA family oxalate/formate antiporter-like MFS transporter|nr:oxalate:formate antiporter [Prolixibacteraceae bacterium]